MTTQQQIENLEKLRDELLLLVNTSIDSMMKQFSNADDISLELPLSSNSKVFKGKKPKAVIINNQEYTTSTWRKLVQAILKEVIKDEEKYQTLKNLIGRINGRYRAILSSNPDILNRPIPITDNIFIEGYYDTETMLNILKEHILQSINYDYSDVYIRYEL